MAERQPDMVWQSTGFHACKGARLTRGGGTMHAAFVKELADDLANSPPQRIMTMRSLAMFGACASIILAGAANFGGVAASAPVNETSPAGDGANAYFANCASCHGETLDGTFGPSLKSEIFRAVWRTRGEGAMRDYIARSMPPSNPGGLSPQAYDQIAAFIEQANDRAPGANPSPAAAPSDAGKPALTSEGDGLAPTQENRDAQYDAAMAERAKILARLRPVSEAMLRHPPAEDWLSWRRTDDGTGFSPLDQIDRTNANRLTLAWSLALPPGSNGITPLVHDGVIFLNSSGTVLALDGGTGETLWSFARPATATPFGPPVTQPRGMAIFETRLYVPTIDNHMVALDIRTGKRVWDRLIPGMRKTMRFSGGPLVAHGKVIQGMSGCGGAGEPGGCFIVALDAGTGRELWRFNTIARPGEPGGDTWNGTPLDQRHGASVWSAGTYDPEENLVYFGTGQTYHIAALMLPDARARPANSGLYTDTTLALNPDSGKLVWHYQHMARDVWDMDWSFERTITTLLVGGKPRKVVMTMGKLGILDVLDARTGRYIFSHDIGLQNLVTAIDPVTGWKTTDPALEPDPKRSKSICPFSIGARNWPATSYDPVGRMLYVPVSDSCMDLIWKLGEGFDISYGVKPRPESDGNYGALVAINLATRKTMWWRKHRAPEASATLSTAGGLVFEGGRDRRFRASDGASGEILWQTRLDNVPSATPVTFAAGGVQYVAITTGGGNPNDVTLQSLTPEIAPTKPGTTLWVFKLAMPPDAR